MESALALRVPDLEAPLGGVEVSLEFGFEPADGVPELEHLVVEPALPRAGVLVVHAEVERGAAVRAGHEAGGKHWLVGRNDRSRREDSRFERILLRLDP